MTRNRLFLLASLLPLLAVQAQTSYEAAALLDTDLNGTARYVGMGGAMGALGADMSTMSTNPAGTALYRSWDAAISFGGNWVTQHTSSNLSRARSFESYGSFDNGGVVIANKQSNEGILRFVNFGFNYRNVKHFDGKMGMASDLGGLSQTWQMATQAWDNIGNIDYTYFDPKSPNNLYDFRNENYGWLTLLGGFADLMGIVPAMDDEGNILYDGEGNVIEEYWYTMSNNCNYTERLRGGIDAFDFNLSFNFGDAVYLGATLTMYEVDCNLESTYSETFADGNYTLQNFYRTVGSGYDFKLGAILRPFSESSFRLGVSATTPAVFSLRDYNSAILNSTVLLIDNATGEEREVHTTIDTYDDKAYGGDCYTDYTMVSPVKVNVSLGCTIGGSWAIGAEYEYSDYRTTKLYYFDGVENMGMNEHIAEYFTEHHTLRLGLEKTFGTFYTRMGYNYQTGGYKDTGYKMIPVNSVQTNTAYANLLSTQNFTCGLGFRGDVFYADAALLYSTQQADFYPFDDPELQATSLTRNLIKGMMTVGMRF